MVFKSKISTHFSTRVSSTYRGSSVFADAESFFPLTEIMTKNKSNITSIEKSTTCESAPKLNTANQRSAIGTS